MRVCKHVPFLQEQLYCYDPVYLSYYDKLFLVVFGAALVAITVGWIQGKLK